LAQHSYLEEYIDNEDSEEREDFAAEQGYGDPLDGSSSPFYGRKFPRI
jgi:hypothetical protein